MIKNIKTAIILCGGLGTRLRPIIGESQKSMADVKGKPFLSILIRYLKDEGIENIIFACGYKSESIKEYFNNGENFDMHFEYAEEKEALGTAGAIKNASAFLKEDKTYVLNGDTLFKIDLSILEDNMIKNSTDLSIAVKNIEKESHRRYGSIDICDGLITNYEEKKDEASSQYISGGIYLIKKKLIDKIPSGKVSFEIDFMPVLMKEKVVAGAVESDASFIDIGTKESYEQINK